MTDRINNKYFSINEHKTIRYLFLLLYGILYLIVSICHEPWFDEAQAWQIAKCASLSKILFEIPHYECHPPLWHLILSVPAKLGVPYELGLKSIGFIISMISCFLILFRSPFPNIIRYSLPFNFFLFYQYGVIVRPYGLLFLEVIMLAITFPNRDEKPWKFTGVMMLLCVTHAYGILISCGISTCWLFEILKQKKISGLFRELVSDRRTQSLVALLVLALLIGLEIIPRENTVHASVEAGSPLWVRLLCLIFITLPDCFLTHSNCFRRDTALFKAMEISVPENLPIMVVGFLFWFFIYSYSSKKFFKYFIVTVLIFSIFCSTVYMTAHHIGVILMIVIFWLWVEQRNRAVEDERIIYKKLRDFSKNSKLARYTFRTLLVLCLAMPIYWNVYSSVNDIRNEYSFGRNISRFLKETGLDQTVIFEAWEDYSADDETIKNSQHMLPAGLSEVFAYFDTNIIANNCYGENNELYRHYEYVEQSEFDLEYEKWREIGIPDTIIGQPDLSRVFGDEVSLDDYSAVYKIQYNYFFKDTATVSCTPLLLRNDLLEKYGLEKIDILEGMHLSGFTDEMIQGFKDGTYTIDDIVDMTLGTYGKTEWLNN